MIVGGWATLSGRRQRHDRSRIAAGRDGHTKREAACVATSGPSLGRKRPRRATIAGSYRIPLARRSRSAAQLNVRGDGTIQRFMVLSGLLALLLERPQPVGSISRASLCVRDGTKGNSKIKNPKYPQRSRSRGPAEVDTPRGTRTSRLCGGWPRRSAQRVITSTHDHYVRSPGDCVAKLVSDLGASLALEFRRFFWYGVSAVSVLLVDFSTRLPVVAGDGRLAWPAASGSARWL
ncbi:hypothetical protein ABIB85_008510 [Bradyrhizobium sp. JR1.5]